MRVDSFCNTLSGRAITYSYTKRGTSERYCPDNQKERMDGLASYDRTNGNLFYGYEVSWKGEVLLDRSVDINVTLDSKEFVDHIDILQSEGSKPKSIEVLTNDEGTFKKIAVYENGQFIVESQLSIPVGYTCDNIVVRLNGAYENVGIKKFNVWTAADLEETVFPMLNQITEREGILPFHKILSVNCKCDEAIDAGAYLKERWKQLFGYPLETSESEASVCMSLFDREDDGFDIVVDEEGCRIQAGCKRGFIYAVDVLVQLAEEEGLKLCSISEKPAFGFRGIHVGLGNRCEFPFLKKFIREMAVPMRYNAVIIEVNAAMRYENLPEINEAWLNAIENYNKGLWPRPAHYGYVGGDILEKDEIRELCAYIRSFGLEIIPEVQCLSHAQYLTSAYPQLAEHKYKPLRNTSGELYAADDRPAEFYFHNMCPLHEDYYKYVFAVIDEVVETFQPEHYLHMGHDEGYDMGECERCAKEIPGKLFADEVSKLNEYIKSKNLTMMIWSDMLQAESSRGKCYSTPEAINWMPKDVVLLDFTWYFHTEQDLEDKLLAAGFKVGIGNLYSSHFPRYEYRSQKPGIIGGQISMWVACQEERYAYEGKMYDMMFTANMLWYSGYNSAFRLSYNEIIKPLLWNTKCRIGDISEEGTVAKVNFAGSLRNIPNELLWNIPYEQAAVISSEAPELHVEIHDMADTIFVVHATDLSADRIMWQPSVKIGEYSIEYEDGIVEVEGVYYGNNICKHSQAYGQPISSILFRHEGYTGTYSSKPICGKDCNGKDYTLLEFPIKNKFPDKKINKVVLRHMQNTDARIYIYDIKCIK